MGLLNKVKPLVINHPPAKAMIYDAQSNSSCNALPISCVHFPCYTQIFQVSAWHILRQASRLHREPAQQYYLITNVAITWAGIKATAPPDMHQRCFISLLIGQLIKIKMACFRFSHLFHQNLSEGEKRRGDGRLLVPWTG